MDAIQETEIRLGLAQIQLDENSQKMSTNENKILANESRITENMEAFISLDQEEHTGLFEELTEVEGINANMEIKISSYENDI